MAVKNLEDLFVHTLKDILYAEKQILKALPKMEKKVGSDELKKAFADHREQTETHVQRLEQVFEAIDKPARAVKCDAIIGIIEEAEELMEMIEDQDTLDAALISAAQAVEHYEITRYGTLVSWARRLDLDGTVNLLEETLEEEKMTDQRLTELAETSANEQAA